MRRTVRPAVMTFVLLSLLSARVASAAIISVNSTADVPVAGDGDCTLREAIDNANLPGGGDVTGGDCAAGAAGVDSVVVPGGLYELTNFGAGDDLNASGDLDILDHLALQGSGADATILAGLAADRVLDIDPLFSGVTAEITGVTVTEGNPPGTPVGGGARISDTASTVVSGCQFIQNRAERGAGIYNNGELLVEGSKFVTNRILAGGDDGGAIYSDNALTVLQSQFDENSAESRGGGIFAESFLEADEAAFLGNTAVDRGGAVFVRADATIKNSTFESNIAANGDGGGVFHAGVFLTFDRNLLTGNEAGADGGGLYAETDAGIGGCDFLTNIAKRGAGLFNELGSTTIADTLLDSNQASDEGGGIYNAAGELEIVSSSLTRNSAQLDGGGLYNELTARLVDTTVDGNRSLSQRGGGILTRVSLELEYSTVSRNTAALRGGGIYNEFANALLGMRNSTISGNTAGPAGGGIFNEGVVRSSFVTIADNSTLNLFGGGLAHGGTAVNAINTIIARNTGDCALFAAIVSLGFNLDSDGTCFGAGPGDLVGVAPLLGPLQLNGGSTETHWLFPLSPAVDSADPVCVDVAGIAISEDQRHFVRPTDGDGNGVARCDRGAFEKAAPPVVPPPVPNGIFGTALTARRVNLGGSIIEVFWDVGTCPALGYHLIRGPLGAVSSYTVNGSLCSIGPTGAVIWNALPPGDLYFLMLADDTVNVEGNWGFSSFGVRNGGTVSGQCGMAVRDNGGACP